MSEQYHIIDTPLHTTEHVQCLINSNIHTVIRYYNYEYSHLKNKQLKKPEAKALSLGGVRIVVVFQYRQNQNKDFTWQQGSKAGRSAHSWALKIGQPKGSAIYFAVDYNPSKAEISSHIIPFFQGVKAEINDDFAIGAYGSGLVVNTLKDKNLCKYRWLSESRDFNGTRNAISTNEYDLRQIYMRNSKVCGLSVDYNAPVLEGHDIGSFVLDMTD